MARHHSTQDKASSNPPQRLANLGFAPGALLMRDPKIFVDTKFLGALLAQLEGELGAEDARQALFEIGLDHGLRDAFQLLDGPFARPAAEPSGLPAARSTAIAMRLERRAPRSDSGEVEFKGHWPDAHEARARLSRIGVCQEPSCHLTAGYTSGWLSGTHAVDLLAVETECMVAGARQCHFEVHELGEVVDHSPKTLLSSLPRCSSFTEFRAHAAQGRGQLESAKREACGPFDPDDEAVHIWGPVMVLPFTSADEALATITTLRHDPSARGLRVAIVDLRGQPLDEAFGAAGLERAIETLESWNVEVVLTGVTALAERALSGIEAGRLVLHKGLPSAIAAAFQIAEAQRHAL